MNDNVIIEFPFNEKIERGNQNFYFKYIWKKVFKGWIRIIILTAIFLFLGFYPIKNFDTNLLYYLIKYMGIFLCGYCFILIYQYFNSKKKFKIEIEKVIQELQQKHGSSYIKLSSEEVEFSNPLYTIKCVWDKTSYSLIEDYLIIHTISNLNYVFNKSELEYRDFETIIRYLENFSRSK
ncbi:hypothetical protein QFZ37_001046 [Chryseobacterium ginsenosidimutans]|uniref:hypothetical protein n=1 Tax=Chryseobacterium ginsenosidimutans TaxID=687846 RepID=UPI00277E4F02|nr:hypothetical protein [Chryseobacterium ginsenosidimutans]MDQ0592677.1 hypothetical protein [Chryseobacterium ginsenosidimutans]